MKKRILRVLALAASLYLLALCFAPTAFAGTAMPDVLAESYVVMDAETGQVLVGKNMDVRGYPASITKIMTLALVLEQIDYEVYHNDLIEASDSAIDALIPRASMIALGRGERATLQDLMHATMIESANDASNVLAEYVCGSIDGFAELMNEKARELGLEGTHFTNPSGQPDDDHFVTARDMGLILKWALSVPGFREIFSTTEYAMGATNMQPGGRVFRNANMALNTQSDYYCPGVVGSKTGYTDQARYTLATSAARDGTELICIVLACPFNDMKYTSTNELLDYCFDNFRKVSFSAADIVTHSVPVFGGGEKALGQIDVYGEGEYTFFLHNSLSIAQVQTQCVVPEKYVIGQPFAPSAMLVLPEEASGQQGGTLATVPLTWSGLEQILAENTGSALSRMAEEEPFLFWGIVAGLSAVVALVAGRIVYVQHRRQKRRKDRLEAARAQLPIRIAERPQPPAAAGAPRSAYRRPSTPNLRVAKGGTAEQPRRIGRAR